MKHGIFIGTQPWFPWPLSRWKWFVKLIPAERLAAMRIAVGLTLLYDILALYLPIFSAGFGPGSLSSPDVFRDRFAWPLLNWSVLRILPEGCEAGCLYAWMLSAFALTVGYRPRLAAVIAWAMGVSFQNENPYFQNGGDRIRHILLLLLAFSPSDAIWAVRCRPRAAHTVVEDQEKQRWVPGWVVHLLFVQLAVLYFMNGYYKALGDQWKNGTAMHYIVYDLTWHRFSPPDNIPLIVLKIATWGTVIWELSFPVMMAFPAFRKPVLWIGVCFHVATFFELEVGAFALYSLCIYVPMVPWERYARRVKPVALEKREPARELALT